MFPVVWCRGCRCDIQLPITLIDRKPRQCIQIAFVQSTLPGDSNQTLFHQFLLGLEQLVTGVPPSVTHFAHWCAQIAVVTAVVLRGDIDQKFRGPGTQGAEVLVVQ